MLVCNIYISNDLIRQNMLIEVYIFEATELKLILYFDIAFSIVYKKTCQSRAVWDIEMN